MPKKLHHKLQSRSNSGIPVSFDFASLVSLRIFIPEEFQSKTNALLNQYLHHTHPANTHSSVDSPPQQMSVPGAGTSPSVRYSHC